MSYDLTISSDDRFSVSTARQPITKFICSFPRVMTNGTSGFILDERPDRFMEISLELVDEEGDVIEHGDDESDEINCIRLHIPEQYYKPGTFDQKYLPVALHIAERVGWTLFDEQTNSVLSKKGSRRWWRFW